MLVCAGIECKPRNIREKTDKKKVNEKEFVIASMNELNIFVGITME